MNKNAILFTFFTISLLNFQLSIGQNVETHQITSNSVQPQLDETCNLMTTHTGLNTYTFIVIPVDLTPNCTHYFKYFAFNPRNNTWAPYLTDSISIPPYEVKVGFSKNVTYRVQHYIVSKENNRSSNIFEADFILKKPLAASDDRLDMLSQRNIEAIPNTDYFSGNNSMKDTPKHKMKH